MCANPKCRHVAGDHNVMGNKKCTIPGCSCWCYAREWNYSLPKGMVNR